VKGIIEIQSQGTYLLPEAPGKDARMRRLMFFLHTVTVVASLECGRAHHHANIVCGDADTYPSAVKGII